MSKWDPIDEKYSIFRDIDKTYSYKDVESNHKNIQPSNFNDRLFEPKSFYHFKVSKRNFREYWAYGNKAELKIDNILIYVEMEDD